VRGARLITERGAWTIDEGRDVARCAWAWNGALTGGGAESLDEMDRGGPAPQA
jgi:hypothetical protein